MLSAIEQEKIMDTADKVHENVEKFNKSQLKHTETTEKNPLPDKESKKVIQISLI